MICPYQLVPSETNRIMSTLLAPVVIVGATPPGHLTLVNVAVNEPVCVKTSTKAEAVAVGIVNVQFADNEQVCTAPVADSVLVAPELPWATDEAVASGLRASLNRASLP